MDEREASNTLKEILAGYSKVEVCGQTAYLKHYCEFERSLIFEEQKEVYSRCIKEGTPTEKEALKLAYENNLWTKDKELEFDKAKTELAIMVNTQQKLALPSQKKEFQKKIEEASIDVAKLEFIRRESIGRTAEEFSHAHGYEKFILSLLFADKSLSVPFYRIDSDTMDLEDDVDHSEITEILEQFKEIHQVKLNDGKISQLILSPFYSNYFNLGEHVGNFFTKSIFEISIYQARLLSLTKTFLNIFKNYRIPTDIAHDPEKVIAFMKNENDKSEKESRSAKGATTGNKKEMFSTRVGATAEDIKELDPTAVINDPIAMLKKNGGKMNMAQLLEAHGI